MIANVFRIALRWQHSSGQNAVNVIHIRNSNPSASPSDVFGCMDRHVTAAMWQVASAGASIANVDITPLDGGSATQSFATGSPAKWTGFQSGDFIPAAAALVKFQTAQRGRSARGRIFIPFVGEGAQSNGAMTPSQAAGLTSDWTTFDSAMGTDSTSPQKLVVASYKETLARDVLVFAGEALLGTQRRRQGRLRV